MLSQTAIKSKRNERRERRRWTKSSRRIVIDVIEPTFRNGVSQVWHFDSSIRPPNSRSARSARVILVSRPDDSTFYLSFSPSLLLSLPSSFSFSISSACSAITVTGNSYATQKNARRCGVTDRSVRPGMIIVSLSNSSALHLNNLYGGFKIIMTRPSGRGILLRAIQSGYRSVSRL